MTKIYCIYAQTCHRMNQSIILKGLYNSWGRSDYESVKQQGVWFTGRVGESKEEGEMI